MGTGDGLRVPSVRLVTFTMMTSAAVSPVQCSVVKCGAYFRNECEKWESYTVCDFVQNKTSY